MSTLFPSRQEPLATLEDSSLLPGGSVFSHSTSSAHLEKLPVNLEDVLNDDDYTGLNDILDDHDTDEGDLEHQEEQDIISREASRSAWSYPVSHHQPSWNFPSELAGTCRESIPTFMSASIVNSFEDLNCSLSPILPSSVPSSPLYESYSRAVAKSSKLSEFRRKSQRKLKKQRKVKSKLDWSAIPREVLQQPYGGKEGPSRGIFKHNKRTMRSLGFLDKHNKVHFRLSKSASHDVRQRASLVMHFNSASNTAPCTPCISKQETLPASSLTDLNFFDGILAPSAADLSVPPSPIQQTVLFSDDFSCSSVPPSASVLGSGCSSSSSTTADSSAVATPLTATPRPAPASLATHQSRVDAFLYQTSLLLNNLTNEDSDCEDGTIMVDNHQHHQYRHHNRRVEKSAGPIGMSDDPPFPDWNDLLALPDFFTSNSRDVMDTDVSPLAFQLAI